ncbi:universal stress protein [Pontibacter locisalis]|uniref:Universal stress protein n=1 Tax=Pontibacter locisalis TaxID=1719035 RepID=A0ABW5IHB6_9BACT
MKTYLVPVDFSDTSRLALEYALDLAIKTEARVLAIHVYEVAAVLPGFAEVMMQETLRETEKEMSAFLSGIDHRGASLSTIVREGGVVGEISKAIKELNISLVIMGTGGGKNLAKKLFGTTTEAVAKKGLCPVLVIPEGAVIKPIEHIVYAADLENGDELTVLQLLQFKKLFNASITFLHIENDKQPNYIPNEYIKENLQQLYPEAGLRFIEIKQKEVAEGISDFVQAHETSLLAFTIINRHLVDRIGHTSVTSRLLHNLKLPMLALPENGILLDIRQREISGEEKSV